MPSRLGLGQNASASPGKALQQRAARLTIATVITCLAIGGAGTADADDRESIHALCQQLNAAIDHLDQSRPGQARSALESVIAAIEEQSAGLPKGPGEASDLLYLSATAHVLLRHHAAAARDLKALLKREPDFARESVRGYPDVRVELARLAFFAGDDAQTRAWLADSRRGSFADMLDTLMAGISADGGSGRTPGGGFQLYTDVGAGGPRHGKTGKLAAWGEIAATLDAARQAYRKVFGTVNGGDHVVHRVYVFAQRQKFDAFSKLIGGATSEKASGYYDPDFKVIVAFEAGQGERLGCLSADTWDTLLHEAIHQFIDHHLMGAPLWFHEGVAEYFGPSRITVSRRRKTLEIRVNPRLADMDYMLRPQNYQDPEAAPRPRPLKVLLLDPGSWQGTPGDYAQAWSVVYYLSHGVRGGQKRLATLFKELQAGRPPRAALQKAWKGIRWPAFEAGWKQWITQLADEQGR